MSVARAFPAVSPPAEPTADAAHVERPAADPWNDLIRAPIIDRGMAPDGVHERCLEPLLRGLGWRGDPGQLVEALPHLETLQGVNDLRMVLLRLGYRSTMHQVLVDELTPDVLPVVVVDDGRSYVALQRAADGSLLLLDPRASRIVNQTSLSQSRVKIYRFHSPFDGGDPSQTSETDRSWFTAAIFRLGGDLSLAAWISFAVNVLALGAPLFSFAVYNSVLPAEGVTTLIYAGAILAAALALECHLRRRRAKVLATASARLQCSIITNAFSKILQLPAALLEGAPVSAQVNRMRQFEGITGVFSGSLVAALFDLPYALLFLAAIGLIGGPLVLAPAVTILLFLILTVLLAPLTDRAMRRVATTKEQSQSLLQEMVTSLDSIRAAGAEEVWEKRITESQRRTASARIKGALLDFLRQSAAQFLMTICAVATLAAGALMVMDGSLTLGALVAVSMLNWRVLGPPQTVFMALHQLALAKESARRYESLVKLKSDRIADKAPAVFRPLKGRLRYREVSFRFPKADEFAIRGVSMSVEPGQTVGVVGPAGAGKSTFLKLSIGLYRPSSGQVLIDGANLAQLHAAEQRSAIAFAPGAAEFFYGTVAQNIRLTRPTATNAEIERLLEDLGVALDAKRFPQGLETRLRAQQFKALPGSFRQKLSLARAFVKNAPLTVLEEPDSVLDDAGVAHLKSVIERRKGETTLLVTAARRPLMESCDTLAAFSGGRLDGVKPAAEILSKVAPDA